MFTFRMNYFDPTMHGCHEIFIETILEEQFVYRHKRIQQNKDICEICMLQMRLMRLIFAGEGWQLFSVMIERLYTNIHKYWQTIMFI